MTLNSPQFELIECGGITLHTALAGPVDGEPIILLHGFPDNWYGWHKQIAALANAGFRVIVPDQRGYNLSSKPKEIKDYKIELLAQDILNLSEKLGYKQINLAGHDWGAAVSWYLSIKYPDRIKKLAILNVPHPMVFEKFVKKHNSQKFKSWYMLFFQIPYLPELLIKGFSWQSMLSQRPNLSEEEKQIYLEAWGQPGALTAMLNWYRAIFRHRPQLKESGSISHPTLIIWGELDRYLSKEMAKPSADYCDNVKLEMIEDATHWVMEDKPELVNRLLVEHFTES